MTEDVDNLTGFGATVGRLDRLRPGWNGHLSSHDSCVELGITNSRLRELAERESIDYIRGVWGVDEAKRMAARLLVIGSGDEREHARDVLRRLAVISAAEHSGR